MIGHIRRVEIRRLARRIRIDAEDGKVPRMAGPHPVVRIPAELADRAWRSPHQADVAIDLIDEEEVLVAVVERLHRSLQSPAAGAGLLHELRAAGPDHGVPPRGRRPVGDLLQDDGRHILHPIQETDRQSRAGQFLLARHRPEAVFQVVVLDAAVPCDLVIAAVVVGQQQPLRGNEFARAAAAEEHDRVLEGSLVDAVDIFRAQAEALGLHVGDAAADQRRQPHPLIRPQHGRKSQRQGHQCPKSLHIIRNFVTSYEKKASEYHLFFYI